MKTRRKQIPIPQWEFGFSADTFNLIQETGIDGERVAREKQEITLAREKSEAAQHKLFSKRRPR
jgi:hypothetical protein